MSWYLTLSTGIEMVQFGCRPLIVVVTVFVVFMLFMGVRMKIQMFGNTGALTDRTSRASPVQPSISSAGITDHPLVKLVHFVETV